MFHGNSKLPKTHLERGSPKSHCAQVLAVCSSCPAAPFAGRWGTRTRVDLGVTPSSTAGSLSGIGVSSLPSKTPSTSGNRGKVAVRTSELVRPAQHLSPPAS